MVESRIETLTDRVVHDMNLHNCVLPPFPAGPSSWNERRRRYDCPDCGTRWFAAKRFINRQPQMWWNELGPIEGRDRRVEGPSPVTGRAQQSIRSVDIDDVLRAFNEFCGDEDLRLVNQYNENVISTDFKSLIQRFIAVNKSRFVL